MKQLIFAAAALMALAGPALSQDVPEFKMADANGDNVVSPDEMKAVMPKMTQAQWDEADADKSGGLSAAEYAQMIAHQ